MGIPYFNKIRKIQKVAYSKICMKDPEVVSDWLTGNGVGQEADSNRNFVRNLKFSEIETVTVTVNTVL